MKDNIKKIKKLSEYIQDPELAIYEEMLDIGEDLDKLDEIQKLVGEIDFDKIESIKGEDGYTPIKGVDYFDGVDGKDGKNGKNGKNGRDGEDGYTPIKGVDYFDGKDGADGKDGSPDTPEDIKNKLESLTGEGRLSITAINGVEQLKLELSKYSNSGGTTQYVSTGQKLRIKSSGTVLSEEPAEYLNITGSGVTVSRTGQGEYTLSFTDLDVACSIGGAVTSGTTGSILFVGAGGVLAQDNSNLYWDDTNNRLGIGTASPFGKLAVEQTGGNQIVARYNSSNGRGGIYTGGSSGATFIGNNLTHSTGNVFNYDTTGTAWYMGNPAGNTYLSIGVGSGTAGNSAGVDDLSTARVNITTAGNVGIGTASPGSKLEVAGKLTVSTTLSGDTVANFINLSSSGYGFRSQGGGGSSGLYLASFNDYAGNEKVRITDAGNVGIGTTNPLSALNVLGTTAINWAGGSNSNGLITFGTGGTSGGSLWLNTPSLNSSYHSGLGVDGTYSNPGGVGTSVVNIGAYGVYSGGGYDSALAFKTSLGLSATEKMRITSAGNVGIGTTTPGSQLTTTSGFALNQTTPATNYIGGNLMLNRADSASEFGTSNNFDLHFRTNDTRRMTILSAGNVGIGTTTPTSKLSVAMDGAFGGLTGANQLTLQGVANPDKKVVLGYDTTNNYGFIEAGITGTGYSNLALQQEGGNVGIGTTDPTGLLSLGTASQTNKLLMYDGGIGNPTAKYGFGIGANTLQIYAGADTATNRIVFGKYDGTTFTENVRFQNDGNVGIGTTTPWRTLAVTGTVGFDGLTGSTGAGSLCLDSNKQVVYNSASDSCLPSLRETKNNIADLSINALEVLQNLDPVSFVYNQGDGRTRYGFIAEDTANVNEFLATYNAEGKISGIDDRAVLSVLVKGFKELWSKVEPILAWFDNGKFSVKGDVCVDDVCVSKEQFKALLLNAGVNGNNNGGGNGGNATTTDTTSPVITLLGDNPAVITVGSVYIDLGATVTDTNENGEVNNNLGLHFNVNGVDVTDISIDTTATSTNTVVFSAVDMAGNWGYATRTVEVVE